MGNGARLPMNGTLTALPSRPTRSPIVPTTSPRRIRSSTSNTKLGSPRRILNELRRSRRIEGPQRLGDTPRVLVVGEHAHLELPLARVDPQHLPAAQVCEDEERTAPLPGVVEERLAAQALHPEPRDLTPQQEDPIRGHLREGEDVVQHLADPPAPSHPHEEGARGPAQRGVEEDVPGRDQAEQDGPPAPPQHSKRAHHQADGESAPLLRLLLPALAHRSSRAGCGENPTAWRASPSTHRQTCRPTMRTLSRKSRKCETPPSSRVG